MMNTKHIINEIGQVNKENGRDAIFLHDKYLRGLIHIDGFSHLQIIWWGHLTDDPKSRDQLVVNKLFKKAPEEVGVFSTRAPARPNPIMITTIMVEEIDLERGIIFTPFIDAAVGSPVIDIKPYFPMERVKYCHVPEWFGHWPKWSEDVAKFNWTDEINFD
jgi:tRNA (Thr-GGU) A37 N-methylase